MCRRPQLSATKMEDAPPPRSPFESFYKELYDSLRRFDTFVDQMPFRDTLWRLPFAWLASDPADPREALQRSQWTQTQRQGLPFSGWSRQEMVPWGESVMQWSYDGWPLRSSCIPRMDLRDAGDKFVLHADMPGLDKNNLKVEAHDGRLSIQAQSSSEQEHRDGSYLLQERCRGSFYRSFSLPPDTQQQTIKASYNNGVLEVSIPKAAPPATPPTTIVNIE